MQINEMSGITNDNSPLFFGNEACDREKGEMNLCVKGEGSV
jgi:hypothetical protein